MLPFAATLERPSRSSFLRQAFTPPASRPAELPPLMKSCFDAISFFSRHAARLLLRQALSAIVFRFRQRLALRRDAAPLILPMLQNHALSRHHRPYYCHAIGFAAAADIFAFGCQIFSLMLPPPRHFHTFRFRHADVSILSDSFRIWLS